MRSTSYPSVNGGESADRGASRTSVMSRRADFASTESLQMTPAPPVNALPPTDENIEVNFRKISQIMQY